MRTTLSVSSDGISNDISPKSSSSIPIQSLQPKLLPPPLLIFFFLSPCHFSPTWPLLATCLSIAPFTWMDRFFIDFLILRSAILRMTVSICCVQWIFVESTIWLTERWTDRNSHVLLSSCHPTPIYKLLWFGCGVILFLKCNLGSSLHGMSRGLLTSCQETFKQHSQRGGSR